MSSIGELISQKRKENRLTQKELADLLHLTPSAISKWENDIAVPHISQFPQIAEALQIPLEELYSLTINDSRYMITSVPDKDTSETNEDATESRTQVSSRKGHHKRVLLCVLLVALIIIASLFAFLYKKQNEPTFKVVDEYFSTEMPYFDHTNVYYVIIEYNGDLTDEYLQACEAELRSTYEDKFLQATVILIQFYESYEGFDSNSAPDMKLALLPTARD